MFGACLALSRDAHGGVRFLEGAYHTSPGAQGSDGVDFTAWLLRDGQFVRTDRVLRIRFLDPADVYRFNVPAP